jgi:NAD(P)-dependent dehydrogenase (short-subunit alcohol dehydrogenase family)
VNVENYRKVVDNYDEAASNEYAKKVIPVARAGEPSDIAKLAVFLCSDDAEYIVGQTIVADGGSTSLMSLAADFRGSNPSHFGKGYLPGV